MKSTIPPNLFRENIHAASEYWVATHWNEKISLTFPSSRAKSLILNMAICMLNNCKENLKISQMI